MSPFQMAKAECAAMVDNGCDGMRIDNALKVTQVKGLKRCLLLDDQRCPYFEACVMPMAAMVTDPVRSQSLMDAASAYRIMHRISDVVRQCECGRPLPARRRMCADCAAKRRKLTYRAAQYRLRHLSVNS